MYAEKLMLLALYEPETEFAELQVFGQAAEKFKESGLGQLAESASRMNASLVKAHKDGRMTELLQDYTRLFLNPAGALASPYISSWKEKLGDDIVERLLETLGKLGFQKSDDFHEVQEHAFYILEVLSALEAEIPADYSRHSEEFQTAADFYKDFVRQWLSEWSDKIRNSAQEDFYRSLGQYFYDWNEIKKKQYAL